MPEPPLSETSLVGYLTQFSSLKARAPRLNRPSPELLAARFGVTGMGSTTRVTTISTAGDTLTASQADPFIRRDIDSVMGFSDDIPITDAIHYFPYPDLNRTLEKRLHVKYGARSTSSVRRMLFSTLDKALMFRNALCLTFLTTCYDK